MKKSEFRALIREELNNINTSPVSNLLSLLADSDFIGYKDALSDQIPPADFDKINKLYKLLYSELKKHDI